jgi:hypothetical protein
MLKVDWPPVSTPRRGAFAARPKRAPRKGNLRSAIFYFVAGILFWGCT